MVKKNKYLNSRSGLTLSAKRLHMSCSASASPMKSVLIPKRLIRSQSCSPCKKPNTKYLDDNSNDHCLVPRHKSIDNEYILSNSSSIIASPNIFSDGVFDFTMCDQCSELRSHSLDSWMDHLGELHPVPVHWPSTRANCLNEHEKRYPYTTVVGSNKKRKASAIPRPLNSFMIFAQYLRRIVLHWFPDAPNVHISQRVGQLWKKLDLKMRDKYVDEAFRLQQLHTIEFPDYKYKPKKRARNVNGVGNNIEADEYISTVENATPSIPKSLTSNNDDNCQTNYENIKFSINQKCFTRVNNSNSDGDYLCNHTPLTVQQHETPIDAIVCHRNYLHPCSQINNKLNTELHEPVKANYTNRNTTHIDHQYDKKVFISNDVNNDDIYKENKEIDETMTVLVSGDRNLEHGTYQLHKIISCQTVDGIAESLISPSLLGQGNQIKEIRILNMQSPTIQLLNKQPILCRAVLCEPVKAAVIRQPTAPIRTNSSILSGFVLNSTANNLDFQPFTTQTTDATISSISPNLSSPFELGYNKPNSNLQSGIKLENVKSPYPNEEMRTKYVSGNNYRVNYARQNDDKRHIIMDSKNPRGLVEIDEKHFDMLSSHHTCTSMSSETTKFENDNVDTVLSFNDIDTCKSGASLDELEQITLFPSEITHSFLQTIDSLNSLSENPMPFTKSEVLDNCQQAMLPANSASSADTLMHTNGLPSIESWTFGTSKSFQLS